MKLFALMFTLMISVNSYSEVCTNTYTPQALYKEGIKKNIHLLLKDMEIQAIDGLIEDARKIINPELEHFTTAGNQFGDRNTTSESRIWFNLQLGNKRNKRGQVAMAEKEFSQAELKQLEIQFKKEIFLGILRYKQISRELGFVINLYEMVEKLSLRYQKVGYLTPEQEVEAGTLNISRKELEFRQASLENESLLIRRFFQKMINEQCDVNVALNESLPHTSWPDLEHFAYEPDRSINFKMDQILIKKSQFVFDRENAQKYPDLKVGPVWQLNKLGNREFNIFGVGFILPLPFERNQGLRSHAQMNLERAKRTEEFNKTQREKEFIFRMESYQRLRTKLLAENDMEAYSAMTVKYNRLFKRGLLSTGSFLNFKRELLNLAVKVHEVETDLATHLMELYRLNDKSTDGFVAKVLRL